jgi:hypothetical protein
VTGKKKGREAYEKKAKRGRRKTPVFRILEQAI